MELIDYEYEEIETNMRRIYPKITVNEVLLLSCCKTNNINIFNWIAFNDLNLPYSFFNDLAFQIACENNNIEMAELLYKTFKIKCNEEIIFTCCEEGNFEILLWLYTKFSNLFYDINNQRKYELFEISTYYIDIAFWLSTIYNHIPIYLNNNEMFKVTCATQNVELAKLLVYMRNGGYYINVLDDKIIHYEIVSEIVISNNLTLHDDEDCIICYKSANILTHCRHTYCLECLETHFEKNNRNCPYCRRFITDENLFNICYEVKS